MISKSYNTVNLVLLNANKVMIETFSPYSPTAPEKFLLYSVKNKVGRLHIDYNNHPDITLPIRNLRSVKAIEYDRKNNSLIWIDARQKDIMISQIDGLRVSHKTKEKGGWEGWVEAGVGDNPLTS